MANSEEKLKDIVAQLGEHFSNVLVIVSPGANAKSIMCRATDPFWAMGAMQHYLNVLTDNMEQSQEAGHG